MQLLEDEALRKDMSQQCRAIALKEYPLELQIQRYLELYRQVLAQPRHDCPGSAALLGEQQKLGRQSTLGVFAQPLTSVHEESVPGIAQEPSTVRAL